MLLSSLFIYNQMGGIDEAALDRLSLVTEMTKHIRVRSEGAAGRCLHTTDIDNKHAVMLDRLSLHCLECLHPSPVTAAITEWYRVPVNLPCN